MRNLYLLAHKGA